jgi:ribonucleoside-triphosphate reductase
MNDVQKYIAKSRYARWIDEAKRRENFNESVDRYITFFAPRIPAKDKAVSEEIREAMINLEVMGSMRSLMTAGKALDRDNAAGFNCSYLPVDDPKAFDEAMYLSMCGCGVGFSVERQFINKLPVIAEEFFPINTVIKVKDSKIGWASAFRQLIALLYAGQIPTWDLSLLRPKGAILKTFGGRSSGPEPLDRLFRFTQATIQGAAGRKLNSLECHDLMCMVADIVVSGGVRRSAMISLSNLSDDRMRNAKNGQWWIQSEHRARSNNSVAYTEKPEVEVYMKEFTTLIESKSGERGIFNREGAKKHIAKSGRREYKDIDFGVNPCVEILLRPFGFCNLSEVVVRSTDTKKDIKRKIRLAVIIGCLQSTLTDFRYLRKIWTKNAEEERLLGVSLTGICDNKLTSTNGKPLEEMLAEFKAYAIEVAEEWSKKLNIPMPAAVTCVKPSGTVSQLVNSSSGIHARYSKYIVRTIREDSKNPICDFLKSQGVKWEPEAGHPLDVTVFYFPMESPDTSVFRNDMTAIEQLELWLTYKKHWTEHNPSCTVYVRQDEWVEVAAWCWKHFDDICGLSFLPHSDHIYKQAPYTEVSKEEYDKLVKDFPVINWDKLSDFENEDLTTGSQESACAGGLCEL